MRKELVQKLVERLPSLLNISSDPCHGPNAPLVQIAGRNKRQDAGEGM
jgi:hypothetical protein